MPYSAITYQIVNRVATVTLNRPRANNAINNTMAQELVDACSAINQDETVRAVIVTGAGKTFSVSTGLPVEGSLSSPRLSPADALSRIRCPVLAAINGDAIGPGLELALAADIRIAVESARLGLPHIISGLIPRDGGTQRLPRLVGRAKGLEMLLTGELITASEAGGMCLVNRVVPAAELLSVAGELARKIAASAPLALQYAKEAVRQSTDLTMTQGLRLETDLYLLLQTTADRTEGITAFLKKRRPRFKGK